MKMILNEYRLMPWQKEAQELIAKQMEDFFFGEGRRSLRATCLSRPSSRSQHRELAFDHELEPRVGIAQRAIDVGGLASSRKDEPQVTLSFRQRHQRRVRLRGDPDVLDAG